MVAAGQRATQRDRLALCVRLSLCEEERFPTFFWRRIVDIVTLFVLFLEVFFFFFGTCFRLETAHATYV